MADASAMGWTKPRLRMHARLGDRDRERLGRMATERDGPSVWPGTPAARPGVESGGPPSASVSCALPTIAMRDPDRVSMA